MTLEMFNEEFEGIRGQLKSYMIRITASVPDTEDIVHDTYIRAVEKLGGFRGESSLKTWVFTIASNIARDNLRARKRWHENVTEICREEAMMNPDFIGEAMHIRATSPHGAFEIREHITFCFTCISKTLPLEQQLSLLLKEVYGFKVQEIAIIISNSEAMVKYYLHTSRARMVQIFDGRCSIINKKGTCHQCSELNGIFNPKQKFQEEIVKIEMARDADNPDRAALLDLRLKIVQATDPFESGASALQLYHLEHNRVVMEKYA